MNDKTIHHVAIAYGDSIPQIAIPMNDQVSAAQTAVFLAENLQSGMTVIVGEIFLPSAHAVSYEKYKQLLAGHRVGKYRELPTGEGIVCDDNFCRNQSTLQIELEGGFWELCDDCYVNLAKDTGAILRYVPDGWVTDGHVQSTVENQEQTQ